MNPTETLANHRHAVRKAIQWYRELSRVSKGKHPLLAGAKYKIEYEYRVYRGAAHALIPFLK